MIRITNRSLFAFGSALLLGLTSCVIVESTEDGRKVTRCYLGYVRLHETPKQDAKVGVSLEEVETIGLRFDQGVGVGYFYERHESIPFDNRVVIRVQNESQYRHLLQILGKLEALKEGNPCVIRERQ